MKLKSLIPLNVLKEADEEKDTETAGGDDAGAAENPFAATGGEDASGEEADAEGGAEGGDETDTEGTAESKPIEISFNPTRVRKYNKRSFQGNKGTVVGVTKLGLTVKMPDQSEIFVSFSDLL